MPNRAGLWKGRHGMLLTSAISNQSAAVARPLAAMPQPLLTISPCTCGAAPLPAAWSKALLESSLSLGMSLAGTSGPLAPWRQAQLAKIFSAGATLRLQFPKEDLGFRWAPGGRPACMGPRHMIACKQAGVKLRCGFHFSMTSPHYYATKSPAW